LEFPLVSFLIPAYNHDRFVQKCLASVLEDPYPNKELIVINDGSTDETGERIAAWVANNRELLRIDYISRENRGLTTTLNELVSRAKGEFLRLGASDDYFLPGGLQAQVKYLMTYPTKLAVIGDSIVVNEKDEKLYESGMAELHRVDKANYLSDSGICKEVISRWAVGGPVTMITRKAFHSLNGWSEDLRIDDWDFFLRLVAGNSLGFIDVKVCAYRIHNNNTSRTKNAAKRIANLGDAEKVAHRHTELFGEPYRTMLKAERYLIRAKIGFLRRNPFIAITNMGRYLLLAFAANMKASVGH
jgi:glycosyltransferase involved in cell wall biosynthesis